MCIYWSVLNWHEFSQLKDHCRSCHILIKSCMSGPFWRQATLSSDNISNRMWFQCLYSTVSAFVIWKVYLCVQFGCMHVWVTACVCFSLSLCFWLCASRRTVFWAKVDIRLTDIGGDSSTVAYGNRLLTAKTWHQRKQVSQAWHSVLLRGLRDRLSAYGGIIKPITSTINTR